MKRTLPLLAIALIALLAGPASAPAVVGGAGHNGPTKNLEAAYKLALYLRSVSADGCYPPPKRLAKLIHKMNHKLKVRVAQGPRQVHKLGIIYILKKGTNCNRVRMAYRSRRGLYILDSKTGNVRVFGRHGPRTNPGQSGPARQVKLVSRTFRLQGPDDTQRLDTLCPPRSFPLGGGMIASPGPSADGEGVYAHSYERLGAQHGWHINAILYDPSSGSGTTPRNVTMQTVCGRGLRPANPSPHNTVFIRSDQIKTATARCPKGQFLIGGGFQRTNFDSTGGNYVTESRADGPSAWRVTGSAFGGSGGGELTAIAYCVKHRGPILTQVSASAPLAFRQSSSVTTPSCPPGLTLTSTGFTSGPGSFYAGSSLNSDGTSTATAYGYFAGVPSLTAYGYCLRARG
jgi:hypothetical protein